MNPQITIDVYLGATALAEKAKLALLGTFGISAEFARCEVRVIRGLVRAEPAETGHSGVNFLVRDEFMWRRHHRVAGTYLVGGHTAFVSGGPRSAGLADPFEYVVYVVDEG